jgi:hypothetical protein
MKFENPVASQLKRPKDLLLTLAEEVAARKDGKSEYGENPYYTEEFQQGDHKITLAGTKHTSVPEEVGKDVALYESVDPDILLHEGNDIHEVFAGLSDDEIKALDPAEVMKKQEQIYLAWRSFKDGKDVRTWDLPFKKTARNRR